MADAHPETQRLASGVIQGEGVMEATRPPRVSGYQTATTQATRFEPARILEVELGRPLRHISHINPRTGYAYCRALALVRFHTQPLGWINLRLSGAGLSADECAGQIWKVLRATIEEHLRRDQHAVDGEVGASNGAATWTSTPPCLEARERVLADAPLVSVVIPTRERPQQVAACVRSLLSLAYPPSRYEIIVVDNAPLTSATAELIRRRYGDSSQVGYVRENRPGVSNARNRGLAVAQGDVVAFVDDDELVDEHWLAGLVGGFAAAERVACVTGLIVPSEIETPAQGWFEQFGGYCKGGCTRHIFNLTDQRPHDPLFPYNVGMLGSGGSMAFRRSILRDVGGFDPALGSATPALAGEDIEALLRVLLAGHTLVYEPAAILYHPPHRDFARLCTQIHGYGTGLTACLLKTLLANPRLLPDVMAKLPPAVLFALSPRSPHHAHKQSDYPGELMWLELRGMLYGPLAYLRSAIKITSERHHALE